MRQLTKFLLRLRSLFSRTAVENELDEELRYHVERQIDEDIARGMSPRDARDAALRAFGGYQQKKEECRDMRGLNVIENLARDIAYAIRQFRKNLIFSCTAVFMLALGICASVAIFVFVDAALLKPLPYRDPQRLIGVYEVAEHCPQCNLSYPDYVDWKKDNKVFSSLDVYSQAGYTLSTPGGAQPTRAARVSDGFFRTLGVTPILGRDFYPGEDLPSAPRSILISYATWKQRYGGKASVMNQTVILNGADYIVVGVLPQDFNFTPAEPAEFWVTMHPSSECDLRRSCHFLNGVGRLKDGVSFSSALADVTVIAKRLENEYPGSNKDQGATLQPLAEVIVGNVRPILLVLLGGAGLLLMIATVNVSSLLLVRSESRRREISVRAALGAGRSRLMRQFMAEGLVLVVAGTLVGLTAADWLIRLLTALIPVDMLEHVPFLMNLRLNGHALAFALAIAAIAATLFSLTPALRISLSGLAGGMAAGSRGSTGMTWRNLGAKLVVLELATAVVLLVAAGLLGRSLALLLRVNLGLQSDHMATLYLRAPDSRYGKEGQAIGLERELIDRIQSLPGVKSVALTTDIPVTHWGDTTWFRVLGRPWHGEHNDTPERDVSSAYFTTLGATLRSGRFFTDHDDRSKPRVAIVNQALARLHFPGENPIGRQLSELGDPPKPMEIVGVVDDIKEGPLDTLNQPVLYRPFDQTQDGGNEFFVVVRTSQSEGALLPAMTAAIHRFDSDIVTTDVATMDERIDRSLSAWIHRSSAWMVGGFAGMALVLSVIGLYGVIAYSVSQRTREIGIRMALGAEQKSVHRLVLKEAGVLTALGIAIGIACSLAVGDLLRALLFGVQPWDVPTLAAGAIVLAIAALLASYLPARRAAGVNPVEALRAE
jgi:macrolide transport system ATP-binding/permease protein